MDVHNSSAVRQAVYNIISRKSTQPFIPREFTQQVRNDRDVHVDLHNLLSRVPGNELTYYSLPLTCTHAHMLTWLRTHMHTCTHEHMLTCSHAYVHTCTHAHMLTCSQGMMDMILSIKTSVMVKTSPDEDQVRSSHGSVKSLYTCVLRDVCMLIGTLDLRLSIMKCC